jgi:hypothetical protein
LFGIGILLNPFINLYGLATSLGDAGRLAGLGLTGADARFEIIALISTVLVTALFVLSIGLLVLFLKRRRIFFRAYVGVFLFGMLALMYDIVALRILDAEDPELRHQATALVRGLLEFLIWSLYFVKSRRVEATFVR